MAERDRELLLEFAGASNLDFECLLGLIVGQIHLRRELAAYVAHRTGTSQKIWMEGGTADDRLMAIRVWRQRRRQGAQ